MSFPATGNAILVGLLVAAAFVWMAAGDHLPYLSNVQILALVGGASFVLGSVVGWSTQRNTNSVRLALLAAAPTSLLILLWAAMTDYLPGESKTLVILIRLLCVALPLGASVLGSYANAAARSLARSR